MCKMLRVVEDRGGKKEKEKQEQGNKKEGKAIRGKGEGKMWVCWMLLVVGDREGRKEN